MSSLPSLRLRCCVCQSRRNSAALVIKLKFGVVCGAGGQITAILFFTWRCTGVPVPPQWQRYLTFLVNSADDDDLTVRRLFNVAGNEVIRYAAVIY